MYNVVNDGMKCICVCLKAEVCLVHAQYVMIGRGRGGVEQVENV